MYLDQTFAQRIDSAKLISKSEVAHSLIAVVQKMCHAPNKGLCTDFLESVKTKMGTTTRHAKHKFPVWCSSRDIA